MLTNQRISRYFYPKYPLSSPFFGLSARLLLPASMQVSKTEIPNSAHTVYIQSVKCIVQSATARSSCTSIDISVRQDTSFQARKHYKKSKILCRFTLSSFCGSVLSSCSSMRRFEGYTTVVVDVLMSGRLYTTCVSKRSSSRSKTRV